MAENPWLNPALDYQNGIPVLSAGPDFMSGFVRSPAADAWGAATAPQQAAPAGQQPQQAAPAARQAPQQTSEEPSSPGGAPSAPAGQQAPQQAAPGGAPSAPAGQQAPQQAAPVGPLQSILSAFGIGGQGAGSQGANTRPGSYTPGGVAGNPSGVLTDPNAPLEWDPLGIKRVQQEAYKHRLELRNAQLANAQQERVADAQRLQYGMSQGDVASINEYAARYPDQYKANLEQSGAHFGSHVEELTAAADLLARADTANPQAIIKTLSERFGSDPFVAKMIGSLTGDRAQMKQFSAHLREMANAGNVWNNDQKRRQLYEAPAGGALSPLRPGQQDPTGGQPTSTDLTVDVGGRKKTFRFITSGQVSTDPADRIYRNLQGDLRDGAVWEKMIDGADLASYRSTPQYSTFNAANALDQKFGAMTWEDFQKSGTAARGELAAVMAQYEAATPAERSFWQQALGEINTKILGGVPLTQGEFAQFQNAIGNRLETAWEATKPDRARVIQNLARAGVPEGDMSRYVPGYREGMTSDADTTYFQNGAAEHEAMLKELRSNPAYKGQRLLLQDPNASREGAPPAGHAVPAGGGTPVAVTTDDRGHSYASLGDVRRSMAAAAGASPLLGFVPSDGAAYGITTGSAEEWARFMEKAARVESPFVGNKVKVNEKFTEKNGQVSEGLFSASKTDLGNYPEVAKAIGLEGRKSFTQAEMDDPDLQARFMAGVFAQNIRKRGSIRKGVGATQGPIARGEVDFSDSLGPVDAAAYAPVQRSALAAPQQAPAPQQAAPTAPQPAYPPPNVMPPQQAPASPQAGAAYPPPNVMPQQAPDAAAGAGFGEGVPDFGSASPENPRVPPGGPGAGAASMDAAVRSAANTMTFGAADAIEGAMPWSAGRETERAVTAAGEKAHPVASAAGSVAGGIGQAALLPGAAVATGGRAALSMGALGVADEAARKYVRTGEAPTLGEAAVAGGVGAAGGAIGAAVGRVGSAIAGKLFPAATEAAGEKAAAKVLEASGVKTFTELEAKIAAGDPAALHALADAKLSPGAVSAAAQVEAQSAKVAAGTAGEEAMTARETGKAALAEAPERIRATQVGQQLGTAERAASAEFGGEAGKSADAVLSYGQSLRERSRALYKELDSGHSTPAGSIHQVPIGEGNATMLEPRRVGENVQAPFDTRRNATSLIGDDLRDAMADAGYATGTVPAIDAAMAKVDKVIRQNGKLTTWGQLEDVRKEITAAFASAPERDLPALRNMLTEWDKRVGQGIEASFGPERGRQILDQIGQARAAHGLAESAFGEGKPSRDLVAAIKDPAGRSQVVDALAAADPQAVPQFIGKLLRSTDTVSAAKTLEAINQKALKVANDAALDPSIRAQAAKVPEAMRAAVIGERFSKNGRPLEGAELAKRVEDFLSPRYDAVRRNLGFTPEMEKEFRAIHDLSTQPVAIKDLDGKHQAALKSIRDAFPGEKLDMDENAAALVGRLISHVVKGMPHAALLVQAALAGASSGGGKALTSAGALMAGQRAAGQAVASEAAGAMGRRVVTGGAVGLAADQLSRGMSPAAGGAIAPRERRQLPAGVPTAQGGRERRQLPK